MQKNEEIDPEFLDVIIQSVSVLSNVATLASTWILLRDRATGGHAYDPDSIRQQLRALRRGLEDTFEAVEAVLRILESARVRGGLPSTLSQPVRFGSATMLLPEELGRLNQHLNQLDNSATQVRGGSRGLLIMMNSANMAPSFNVRFDPEGLNQQLNSILFESQSLGDAMTKLRLAQQQAEDFVSEIERTLRRN
ncbi:hypothetical protein [Bradyrhizobium sp. 23AC]